MHNFAELTNQINWLTTVKLFVQAVIICYCVVWIWKRILGTQAERLVKGVMVLIAVCVISYFVGFTLVTSILQQTIPVAVLALLIVFQPEVRRGLGYIGRMKPFSIDFSLTNVEHQRTERDIEQIIAAVRELSRNRIGALLVVEPPEGERDYLTPGTPINADISTTLILSIFFPNSPLHDGALVVRDGKIIAAGVILPMTDDPKLSYRYGTRHRAAIGLSEIYDGLCVVVSEETGSISAASRGMLVRYNEASELSDPLKYLYSHSTTDGSAHGPLNAFLTLFNKGRRDRQESLLQINTANLQPLGPVDSPSPAVAPDLHPTVESARKVSLEQRLTGENVQIQPIKPTEPEQVL